MTPDTYTPFKAALAKTVGGSDDEDRGESDVASSPNLSLEDMTV